MLIHICWAWAATRLCVIGNPANDHLPEASLCLVAGMKPLKMSLLEKDSWQGPLRSSRWSQERPADRNDDAVGVVDVVDFRTRRNVMLNLIPAGEQMSLWLHRMSEALQFRLDWVRLSKTLFLQYHISQYSTIQCSALKRPVFLQALFGKLKRGGRLTENRDLGWNIIKGKKWPSYHSNDKLSYTIYTHIVKCLNVVLKNQKWPQLTSEAKCYHLLLYPLQQGSWQQCRLRGEIYMRLNHPWWLIDVFSRFSRVYRD